MEATSASSSIRRTKRIVVVAVALLAVIVSFLAMSRLPALGQKASLGGDTPIADLGFDVLIDVDSDASVTERIAAAGVNWLYTNRQGMAFGLVAGALIMTLLPLLSKGRGRNRFSNSVIGLLSGSPLGVCVNCAAPIAQGIHAGGGGAETMLAAMVSSPTMNIVVLTMLFTLLPPYLGLIKVGLTLAFILLVIPLLTRMLPGRDPVGLPDRAGVTAGGYTGRSEPVPVQHESRPELESWPEAALAVGRSFVGSLWFIAVRAIPLMVLAGFLGAALITLLPFETLTNIGVGEGALVVGITMAVVAIVGLFLPVPMAFDVIVVAVLLRSGIPARYGMILLFCLGIFSVYPFLLVKQSLSGRLAGAIVGVLLLFGMIGGALAHVVEPWYLDRQNAIVFDALLADDGPVLIPDTTGASRGPTARPSPVRFAMSGSNR